MLRIGFGNLIARTLPGSIVLLTIYLLLGNLNIIEFLNIDDIVANLGSFTFILVLFFLGSLILGVLVDSVHHWKIDGWFRGFKSYRATVKRGREVYDSINQLVNKKINSLDPELRLDIKIRYEWWTLNTILGPSGLKSFLDNFYSFYEFFVNIFWVLIPFAVLVFWYLTLNGYAVWEGIFISGLILTVSLFSFLMARMWLLKTRESHIQLSALNTLAFFWKARSDTEKTYTDVIELPG